MDNKEQLTKSIILIFENEEYNYSIDIEIDMGTTDEEITKYFKYGVYEFKSDGSKQVCLGFKYP